MACRDLHPATNTFQGRVRWEDADDVHPCRGVGTCVLEHGTRQVPTELKFNLERGAFKHGVGETDEQHRERLKEEAPYRMREVQTRTLVVTMEWVSSSSSSPTYRTRVEVRLQEGDFDVYLWTAGMSEARARSLPDERVSVSGHPLFRIHKARLCHLDATLVIDGVVSPADPCNCTHPTAHRTHMRYQLPQSLFHDLCAADYPKTRICAYLPPLCDPGGVLQMMRDQRLVIERHRLGEIAAGRIRNSTEDDRSIGRHVILEDRGLVDILNTKWKDR